MESPKVLSVPMTLNECVTQTRAASPRTSTFIGEFPDGRRQCLFLSPGASHLLIEGADNTGLVTTTVLLNSDFPDLVCDNFQLLDDDEVKELHAVLAGADGYRVHVAVLPRQFLDQIGP